MKILHIVPGLEEGGNGIAVAAKLIAAEQGAEIVDARRAGEILTQRRGDTEGWDEVWVHSMWLPKTMCACWKVIRAGKKLVRMTHANLDPLRYRYHGWKKRLVAPIERWLFKQTDRVVVTCEAEKKWCEQWGLKNRFEIVDLKKYFNLGRGEGLGRRSRSTAEDSLHVLYLGRRHPLKGVEFLEQAVEALKNHPHSNLNWQLELRCVSDHFGEDLERDWDWCDVLVLPTLSENFGLVVAEALERGKRVITTDGAPAWESQGQRSRSEVEVYGGTSNYNSRLVYLRGYRDGTDEERVRLLKEALVGRKSASTVDLDLRPRPKKTGHERRL